MTHYAISKISYDLTQNFRIKSVSENFSYDSSSALVGWWRLDTDVSGGGAYLDSSGNGNDASTTSSTSPNLTSGDAPSKFITPRVATSAWNNSVAMVADAGDSSKFSFGDGTSDGPFSIAAWINIPSTASWNTIVGKFKSNAPQAREWLFGIDTSRRLRLDLHDETTDGYVIRQSQGGSPIQVPSDQWVHVAVVYSGIGGPGADSGVSFYINGSLKASTGSTTSAYIAMSDTASSLTIGNYTNAATTNAFEGNMAEVAVWSTALTVMEISTIYNASRNISYIFSRNYNDRGSTATHTGSIDPYRQGVSILTTHQRFMGLIPKIASASPPKLLVNGKVWAEGKRFFDDSAEFPKLTSQTLSGSTYLSSSDPITNRPNFRVSFAPNHELEIRDFGVPKLFKDDEPYLDMRGFEPVVYISDDTSTMIYPYIAMNASMRDPDQMDGVIEPLTIRSRASNNSIDWPFEAHGIWGFLCDGAEDSRRRSCPIKQQLQFRPKPMEPFEDGGYEHFGTGITIPGYLHNSPAVTSPWVESEDIEVISQPTITSGSFVNSFNVTGVNAYQDLAIFAVLTEVTGSSIDTMADYGSKSATAGFEYDNAPMGTDSLAYGGLKK